MKLSPKVMEAFSKGVVEGLKAAYERSRRSDALVVISQATKIDQLPSYLAHENELVRDAAMEKLKELQGRKTLFHKVFWGRKRS